MLGHTFAVVRREQLRLAAASACQTLPRPRQESRGKRARETDRDQPDGAPKAQPLSHFRPSCSNLVITSLTARCRMPPHTHRHTPTQTHAHLAGLVPRIRQRTGATIHDRPIARAAMPPIILRHLPTPSKFSLVCIPLSHFVFPVLDLARGANARTEGMTEGERVTLPTRTQAHTHTQTHTDTPKKKNANDAAMAHHTKKEPVANTRQQPHQQTDKRCQRNRKTPHAQIQRTRSTATARNTTRAAAKRQLQENEHGKGGGVIIKRDAASVRRDAGREKKRKRKHQSVACLIYELVRVYPLPSLPSPPPFSTHLCLTPPHHPSNSAVLRSAFV